MKFFKNKTTYLIIFLVIVAHCAQESEAVRRVLRGRRTLTRRYFNGLGIPGWVLIVLIAVGELVIGAALYFIMQKVILSKEVEQTNTYTPAPAAATAYDPVPKKEI